MRIVIENVPGGKFRIRHSGVFRGKKGSEIVKGVENKICALLKTYRNNNLRGKYFKKCMFCVHDGKCILRHNEFMGVPAGRGVDKSPYLGHERLDWHFSWFQTGRQRSACTGRILPTESPFFPLACECSTVIDEYCLKFKPNELGRKRIRQAKRIAAKKKVSVSDLEIEDLPEMPPYDSIRG